MTLEERQAWARKVVGPNPPPLSAEAARTVIAVMGPHVQQQTKTRQARAA